MENQPNVFSNSEITVTYSPVKCNSCMRCAKELANVFRDSVIPWIDLDAESTKKVIDQVKKCPTGALRYHFNLDDVA